MRSRVPPEVPQIIPALLFALALGTSTVVAEEPTSATLQTIHAIREIVPPHATHWRADRVRGVVTYADENTFFFQDGEAAVFARLADEKISLSPGDLVEVSGVISGGAYLPSIEKAEARIVGKAELPAPERLETSTLPFRKLDCLWVETVGIVRSVIPEEGTPLRWEVNLGSAGGHQVVRLSLPRGARDPAELVDAKVAIRGSIGAYFPKDAQRVRFRVNSSGEENFRVITPPPEEPFSIPLQSAFQVLRGALSGRPEHRERVAGTVLHVIPGAMWLRDDSMAFRVHSSQTKEFHPGDAVEVVGFVDPAEFSPVIADALCQKSGAGPSPEPRSLIPATLVRGDQENDLVRLEATITRGAGRGGDQPQIVTAEFHDTLFSIELPNAELARSLEPGTRVSLAGIWLVAPQAGDPNAIGGYRLLVRSPEDLTILQLPPKAAPTWLLWPAGIIVLGGVGAILRSVVLTRRNRELDRRVRERTAALEAAHEKLQASAEWSAILAERNRIAQEIHDSFEQGFTGIILQIDSALPRLSSEPGAARRYLELARKMVQFIRSEAHHAVWNLHSSHLAGSDLHSALAKLNVQPGLGVDGPEVKVSVVGEPRRLDAGAEHHLLRIAQEAVTNALKHARASLIEVRLTYSPTEVCLTVSDNGAGFATTEVARQATMHLGLSGMRDRANKLGARCDIQSSPGSGTQIAFILPDVRAAA
ncbi:MAG TPA: sensor histidine kinase [Chthoniobacteraceae bacterium]